MSDLGEKLIARAREEYAQEIRDDLRKHFGIYDDAKPFSALIRDMAQAYQRIQEDDCYEAPTADDLNDCIVDCLSYVVDAMLPYIVPNGSENNVGLQRLAMDALRNGVLETRLATRICALTSAAVAPQVKDARNNLKNAGALLNEINES